MALKFGYFENLNRNTWKVMTCDAGGGVRISVGPIM
jgi:hypothetical protein